MLIILLRVVSDEKQSLHFRRFDFSILYSGVEPLFCQSHHQIYYFSNFCPHEQSKSNQQSRAQPKTSCRKYHTSPLEKKVLANASNSYDHGPSLNSCQLLTTTVFISQGSFPPICCCASQSVLFMLQFALCFTGLCKNCLVTSDHKFSISYLMYSP